MHLIQATFLHPIARSIDSNLSFITRHVGVRVYVKGEKWPLYCLVCFILAFDPHLNTIMLKHRGVQTKELGEIPMHALQF
jgi:hypothetical protein